MFAWIRHLFQRPLVLKKEWIVIDAQNKNKN